MAAPREFRRRIERLEALPLRPATARFLLSELPEEPDGLPDAERAATARWRSVTDLDPGWAVARPGWGGVDVLGLVADRPWWPGSSPEANDALWRHWRHSVAVSLAARRLAREANDPDPDALARAGLLHGLGRWAVAAVQPEWLSRWIALDSEAERRALEVRELGVEIDALGRSLAERWGCEPLVVDACWLHADAGRGLESAAGDPGRIVLLQEAFRLAERTPWSLCRRGSGGDDPWVKMLTAEVQSRCGTPFLEADATTREERLVRSNARLRKRVAELATGLARRDRFLSALRGSEPGDDPETWAERAGLAWCAEPGVTAARVEWGARAAAAPDVTASCPERPSAEVPLVVRGRPLATVRLWSDAEAEPAVDTSAFSDLLPAWSAWASMIDDRARREHRLSEVLRAVRRLAESDEARLGAAKIEALAEFAAGAGHELNNPLAVIVGRAQLLLLGQSDARTVRSLRAILGQAQRAHRILRDLMYYARPPEPRPRPCQPDEIVRACLRDARDDSQARDVRLTADSLEHNTRVWADPDGLRHLADTLVRNAVDATPKGGLVRFSTRGDSASLLWTVHDTGHGIAPTEGSHLFDPFYCGRQAGRGLGLGLPRAARFVEQLGGEIRWQSDSGRGSTFHVRLPLPSPPSAAEDP